MPLFKKADKPPALYRGGALSYQVANQQHIGRRERQEDSFGLVNPFDVTAIRKDGLLAVVADGMGGMEDGAEISEAAVEMCRDIFRLINRKGDIAFQLRSAMYRIDDALFDRYLGRGGTTIVIAMIYDERLYWYSIGDSAIYLRRGGILFKLNIEQNVRTRLYLDELFEEAETDRQRAEADPDGVRLTQFLASGQLKEVDGCFVPLTLKDGDVILMCSDGVNGIISDARLLELLDNPARNAAKLIEREILAENNPRQDNFTSVIIRCCI
ncbi:MAG: protein phosphatase 2C domain-containing protein [Oscillospiraceae bacterium]|jgi:protein phosphatase|nr:protein phosphatase 2C domain-containing protein [Oscillospiraceae bacterium]